jgi:hypothetical protein
MSDVIVSCQLSYLTIKSVVIQQWLQARSRNIMPLLNKKGHGNNEDNVMQEAYYATT